jgi:hypothetical protein
MKIREKVARIRVENARIRAFLMRYRGFWVCFGSKKREKTRVFGPNCAQNGAHGDAGGWWVFGCSGVRFGVMGVSLSVVFERIQS